MKNFALPLALVAALGMSSVAFAAPQTTVGSIKSIDSPAMSLTLTDGTQIYLPANYKVADLKVGEKVSVVWDMMGTKHQASAVTMAK